MIWGGKNHPYFWFNTHMGWYANQTKTKMQAHHGVHQIKIPISRRLSLSKNKLPIYWHTTYKTGWIPRHQKCAIGSINSHYFHIIGDKLIKPIVGVYIPIIRIPYSRLDDHPQYKELIDPGWNDSVVVFSNVNCSVHWLLWNVPHVPISLRHISNILEIHHCLTVCPWKLWCLEPRRILPFSGWG